MGLDSDVVVNLIARTDKLEAGLDRSERHLAKFQRQTEKTSGGLKSLGAFGAVGAIAGIGALGEVVKSSFDELANHEKVTALTDVALRNLGKGAAATAPQIEDTAKQLALMSGVSHNTIQQAENMALSFQSVGTNAGLLKRVTVDALDVSARTGKDMTMVVRALGRAMDDPQKGMASLARTGIFLTGAQKDTVKAMMKHNEVAQAQAYILGLVEQKSKGAAAAIGNTTTGQVNRLKEAFSQMEEQIAQALLPAILAIGPPLLKIVQAATPLVVAFAKALSAIVTPLVHFLQPLLASKEGMKLLGAAIAAFIAFKVADQFAGMASAAKGFGSVLSAIASTNPMILIVTAIAIAVVLIATHWDQIKAIFRAAVGWIQTTIVPVFTGAMNAITSAFRFVVNWVRSNWPIIAMLIAGPFAPIVALATNAFGIRSALLSAMQKILSFVSSSISGVVNFFANLPGRAAVALGSLGTFVVGAIRSALVAIVAASISLGSGIIQGIIHGIGNIASTIGNALTGGLKSAVRGVMSAFGIRSPSRYTSEQIGVPLSQGIILGMEQAIIPLGGVLANRLKTAVAEGRVSLKIGISQIMNDFVGLKSAVTSAFNSNTSTGVAGIKNAGAAATPAEAALAALTAAHDKQAHDQNMSAARAQLASAQASGDPQAIASAQQALNDLLYQDQVAALQAQATAERTAQDKATAAKVVAYQKERALQKAELQKELADLTTHLNSKKETYAQKTRELAAFLHDKKFVNELKQAGITLGNSFVDGLNSTHGKVTSAVTAIAKAIADYLKLHSPAKKGPLSSLNTWWTAFTPTLLAGLDTRGIDSAMNSLGSPAVAGGRTAGGGIAGGGGTMIVNVTVNGNEFSARDFARKLKPELDRIIAFKSV